MEAPPPAPDTSPNPSTSEESKKHRVWSLSTPRTQACRARKKEKERKRKIQRDEYRAWTRITAAFPKTPAESAAREGELRRELAIGIASLERALVVVVVPLDEERARELARRARLAAEDVLDALELRLQAEARHSEAGLELLPLAVDALTSRSTINTLGNNHHYDKRIPKPSLA